MKTPDEPTVYHGPDGWAVGYPSHLGEVVQDGPRIRLAGGYVMQPSPVGGLHQTDQTRAAAARHQGLPVRSLDLNRGHSDRCDCNACAGARLGFLRGLHDPDVDWLLDRYHHEVTNGCSLRAVNLQLTTAANRDWPRHQRAIGARSARRVASGWCLFLAFCASVSTSVTGVLLAYGAVMRVPAPLDVHWRDFGAAGALMVSALLLSIVLNPEEG